MDFEGIPQNVLDAMCAAEKAETEAEAAAFRPIVEVLEAHNQIQRAILAEMRAARYGEYEVEPHATADRLTAAALGEEAPE